MVRGPRRPPLRRRIPGFEHDPSGIKRYYGRDPFAAKQAKIKNTLGEHAWLLLREEDQFGNAITNEYHHIADQNRANKRHAQKHPILWRVTWGGNRLTNLSAQFVLTTSIEPQDGPIDMLQGSTILTSKITKIDVGTPADPDAFWTYTLTYEQSPSTRRELLTAIEREGFGTYPTYHRTSFHYTNGTIEFTNWQNLDSLGKVYAQIVTSQYDIHPAISTLKGAVEAEGFRAAAKFLDYNGDGRTDALYHGAGLHVPQASILTDASRFGCANGPPCFGGATDLPPVRGSEIVDLDGDGDLDFMAFGEEVTVCHPVGEKPPAWTSAAPIALDPAIPLIMVNPHLESGVAPVVLPEFTAWPSWVRRAAVVTAAKESSPIQSGLDFTVYAPHVTNDFEAPVVDLNADGRPDVVLIRGYSNNMKGLYLQGTCLPIGGMTTGYAIGMFKDQFAVKRMTVPRRMGRALDTLERRPLPASAVRRLKRIMPDRQAEWLARQPIFSFVAENQFIAVATEVESYADDLMDFAKQVGRGFGGQSGGGDGAGLPDPDGGGDMPNPDGSTDPGKHPSSAPNPFIGIYWTGDGWIEPDITNPTPWLPGGCPGQESFAESFTFVPRAYVADDGSQPGTLEFDAARGFGFTKSLKHALPATHQEFGGGSGGSMQEQLLDYIVWLWEHGYIPGPPPEGAHGCAAAAQPPYPEHVDFNSFFLDVNGDSLPDLILAEPPVNQNSQIVCQPGHRVLINRGYGFEERAPADLTSPDSPWPAEQWSAALSVLKNRGRACAGSPPAPTKFVDVPLAGSDLGLVDSQPDAFGIPMSAAAFADVNADGRVDIVLAYKAFSLDPQDAVEKSDRKVLLNTSRGFEPMPQSAVDALLPPDFYLALSVSRDPVSTVQFSAAQSANHPAFKPTWSDWGRLVDLNNDGLVDLLQPGEKCAPLAGPCVSPARWKRNIGAVPDLLRHIESSTGSFTEVDYEPALVSASVTMPPNGIRPSPSARVATKIRTSAVPADSTLSGAPPAQDIMLAYANFVRDPVSREQIGYENVTARFQNAFGGKNLETVTVTERFDVRADVPGILVRHPLQGRLVEVITTSSDAPGEQMRMSSRYALSPLGNGVRVRSEASFTEHCLDATCAITGSESTAFDPLGFPTEVRKGDSNGQNVIGDVSVFITDYEHQPGPWILGLPISEQVFGKSMGIGGTWTSGALLAHIARTYYPTTGALHTAQRPGFQAAGCASAGINDVEIYEYTPEGLVSKVTTASERVDVIEYPADRLYADKKKTSLRRYVDGAEQGTTLLEMQVDFDRRTGKPTYLKDQNGNHQMTERDSLGRERKVSIVAPTPAQPPWLREIEFDDDATPSVQTRTFRRPGTSVIELRHVDSQGHVLGAVEEWDGGFVRRQHQEYDAFGRIVETALPNASTSLQNYSVVSDPRRVVTVTDGFDRVRSITRPDGTATNYHYAPRLEVETNPRTYKTQRALDWRGQVIAVTRLGDGAAVIATHTIARDGLGRIVEIRDADDALRRFERDLGGRTRYASLPHAPSAQAHVFAYCHDVEDALVSSLSPDGRVMTIQRDELGRAVSAVATHGQSSVVSFQSYDDPAGPNGLGRLTRVVDESGVTAHGYDAFGRLSLLEVDLPASLASAGTPSNYEVHLTYDWAGNLDDVVLEGTEAFGGNAVGVTYERDSRGRATAVTISTAEPSGAKSSVTVAKDIQFDTDERLIAAQFGTGVTASWAYDPLHRRLSSIEYRYGQQSIAKVFYPEYDEQGNLERELRHGSGGALLSEKLHTYDPLDRLRTTSLAHPLGTKLEEFEYTPSGNVKTAGINIYTYGLTGLSQAATNITGANGASRTLEYSADGQLVTDTQQNAGGGKETRTLTWDAAGCLTAVTADHGGATPPLATALVCNSAGESIARRSTTAGQTVESSINLGIGELRPHEGHFVLRLPVAGTVLIEEARSLSTGERVVAKSGYLFNDVRGSVLARMGFEPAAPAIVEEAEYDAWGATEAVSALPAPVHQFTGAEPDWGLGLYYFGVRAYDPTLRRWLSPDPLILAAPEAAEGNGEQLNLYQYAANNPIGRIDPHGLQDEPANEGTGAGQSSSEGCGGVGPRNCPDDGPPTWLLEESKRYNEEHAAQTAAEDVAFYINTAGNLLGGAEFAQEKVLKFMGKYQDQVNITKGSAALAMVAPVADIVGSMSDSPEEGSAGQFVHALGAVIAATGTTVGSAGAIAAAGGALAGGVGAAPGLTVAGVGSLVSLGGNAIMGIGGAISALQTRPPPGSQQSAVSRALTGAVAGILGKEWADSIPKF